MNKRIRKKKDKQEYNRFIDYLKNSHNKKFYYVARHNGKTVNPIEVAYKTYLAERRQ